MSTEPQKNAPLVASRDSHAACEVMVNPEIEVRRQHDYLRIGAVILPVCACCRGEASETWDIEWALNQWVLNYSDNEPGSDWIHTLCSAHEVDLAAVLLKREGGCTLCSHCNRYSDSYVGGFCSVVCRDEARAAL